MKLLIAYDGSRDAEAAIDDLHSCGLPETGSAKVISVAEVWLPPPGSLDDKDEDEQTSPYIEEIVREYRLKAEKELAEAEMLATFAMGRVKATLPGWDVTSVASYGSPGWEIVNEAEKMDSDLIVVGAQGRSFLSRLVLGSISQRVLTEAYCSVRVGRGRIDLDLGATRLVVGFDGSHGAKAAVASIADRTWTEGTEVTLIAANEPSVSATIGRFVTPTARAIDATKISETTLIERSARAAVDKLRSCGLVASFRVEAGNPKDVLPNEAEKLGADCIFVGANAWGSRLERFLIGSTSAAVAARSHCSVEVVRAKLSAKHITNPSREHGHESVEDSFPRGERR